MCVIPGKFSLSLTFVRIQLEWKAPDVDGLVQFLVVEKGFKSDFVPLVRAMNSHSILFYLVRNGFGKEQRN